MEQERRDHELALRLATETGSGVEDMPVLKRSSLVTAHRYGTHIVTAYSYDTHIVTAYSYGAHIVTAYRYVSHIVTVHRYVTHIFTAYRYGTHDTAQLNYIMLFQHKTMVVVKFHSC